jgi:hypothetical protein
MNEFLKHTLFEKTRKNRNRSWDWCMSLTSDFTHENMGLGFAHENAIRVFTHGNAVEH